MVLAISFCKWEYSHACFKLQYEGEHSGHCSLMQMELSVVFLNSIKQPPVWRSSFLWSLNTGLPVYAYLSLELLKPNSPPEIPFLRPADRVESTYFIQPASDVEASYTKQLHNDKLCRRHHQPVRLWNNSNIHFNGFEIRSVDWHTCHTMSDV